MKYEFFGLVVFTATALVFKWIFAAPLWAGVLFATMLQLKFDL